MNIKDYKGGWLCGDFVPSIFKTKHFEVGVKSYKKGDKEPSHKHKVAMEVSVVISGRVKMKTVMEHGDIVVLQNEYCSFEALEDTTMLVIKYPSAPEDKYYE